MGKDENDSLVRVSRDRTEISDRTIFTHFYTYLINPEREALEQRELL